MNNKLQRRLGFLLIGIGVVLIGGGIFQLTRPDEYRAQTRISLHSSNCECVASIEPDFARDFEPFLAAQMQAVQTESILSNVVARLDLCTVWGRKYSQGRALSTANTITQLRRRLVVRQVTNTKLAEIRVVSEDPTEAATIVNTIAETYLASRHDRSHRLMEMELAVLVNQHEMAEKRIVKLEGDLERLRQELSIPLPEPDADFLTINFRAYADAKQDLEERKDYAKLLARKIKTEQDYLSISHDPQEEILERATPASMPRGRPRRLGRTFVVSGCAFLGLGVALFLNARLRQS